jgi:hypothetical protein
LGESAKAADFKSKCEKLSGNWTIRVLERHDPCAIPN